MALLPDITKEAKIISGEEKLNEFIAESSDSKYSMQSKLHSKSRQNSFCAASTGFPSIVLNSGGGSLATKKDTYQKLSASNDFLHIKHSPSATQYSYKWKPLERLTNKMVQARVKIFKASKRIDQPARQASPFRVAADWETSDAHFHNEKRTLEMKRMQYLREHTNWSIYPYASIDEREEYNKNIRETLKEQMKYKDLQNKMDSEKKIIEYKNAALQDSISLNEAKQKMIEKKKFLRTFRDENKQLMQERWIQSCLIRKNEWQHDTQYLEADPINWSKTLK